MFRSSFRSSLVAAGALAGCLTSHALCAPGQPPYPVEITDDGREVTCYTEIAFNLEEQIQISNSTGSFAARVSSTQSSSEAAAAVDAIQQSTMSPVNFAGSGSASASSFA